MTVDILSAAAARRLVLHKTGLTHTPSRRLDEDALAALILHMGFVQVDSIAWVERAHQMILFARNQTYKPELLRRMLEEKRSLFENWTHDAAIIPTEFYPFWKWRFAQLHETLRRRWAVRGGPDFASEMARVRERIAEAGSVMSRDFKPPEKRQSGGWWDWHHGKTALEYLWRTGEVAICRRDNFQKCYDLASRVLPHIHDAPVPADTAVVDWACRESLKRLGFGTPAEIAGFFSLVSTEDAQQWCLDAGSDSVRRITVEGKGAVRPRQVFANVDIFTDADAAPEPPKRLRVLNPFDPLLRDRKRLKHLFDFDYRIEIFVPEAKRTYGYYVFPLLEGERLVGRIDMKAERQQNLLSVTALWLEPKIKFSKVRQRMLAAELARIAKFVGLDRVAWRDGYLKTPA